MANAFIFSHPQRTEIKKAADESQSILEKTPVGEGNDEGPLQKFLKVHIALRCVHVTYLAEFGILYTCSCYNVMPRSQGDYRTFSVAVTQNMMNHLPLGLVHHQTPYLTIRGTM